MGAVFEALPVNPNVEIVEDQKRGQELQGDEVEAVMAELEAKGSDLEAVLADLRATGVLVDECQTSTVLVGNDKLNLSAQVVPVKQEVLQLPSVPLDRKKEIEEGQCTPQVFTDKNATGSEDFNGAANIVGNIKSNLKDTGDLFVIIVSFIHVIFDVWWIVLFL